MKTKLLRYLEARRGEFVSGESLAEKLGVTRSAVWKAIASLRKEGHIIDAATNKGYKLMSESDTLTEEGIRQNLREGSRVRRIICLDEVDSTNNYAKRLALTGAEHGTLVVADRQTAGRGRYGHTFESPAGTGLYMSLILKPKVDAERFQMITIADAVAVCLGVEHLYPEAQRELGIKWVNDIFFRGRKIAGILTEAVTGFESGEIESVVTGIGINVSTKNFSAETAGSIFCEGECPFRRDKLCALVADGVMDFAEDLGTPALINTYRERSILTGQDITYMKNEAKCTGHVEGIDDTGGLVIQNEAGKLETLRSGEVFMVRTEEKTS
ncbi:MAG: biotin--[Synergistaceae bacterium]|nr:biotin--[acetyl-CoA-carboxylase] ligase [Synergistaceae bacterium]